MTLLGVPGADLYYETHGHGPLLISGSRGQRGRRHLSRGRHTSRGHYTVVLFDRRGFSRSTLDGPQDYPR